MASLDDQICLALRDLAFVSLPPTIILCVKPLELQMPNRTSNSAPPTPKNSANQVPALLLAAIAEQAAHQGLTLAMFSHRAGLGDPMDRIAADNALAEELRLTDITAIAHVLGLSASTLIAQAEPTSHTALSQASPQD